LVEGFKLKSVQPYTSLKKERATEAAGKPKKGKGVRTRWSEYLKTVRSPQFLRDSPPHGGGKRGKKNKRRKGGRKKRLFHSKFNQ